MRHRRPRGRSIDRAIDALVPNELRYLSSTHWTPAEIAMRAVALLAPTPGERILDIGAGIGKLCSIGALSVHDTIWCGVEQHQPLVAAARDLARALGVTDRTTFLHGDALALDWTRYDALYLYNPFELTGLGLHQFVGVETFRAEVARVEARLASLPGGVRVVTLHGFGGAMPPSFELVYQEHMPQVGHDLVLWRQRPNVHEEVRS
jgi:SAM-dependent methyltransferase